jgi:hypothetical protein
MQARSRSLPFIVSLAIFFQLLVVAPLYLLFSQGDQFPIAPLAFLGWPLLTAVILSLAGGALLFLTSTYSKGRLLALASALGIYIYLQFYGLVWDFGIFDGRAIAFGAFKWQAVLETVLLAALAASAIAAPAAATRVFGRFLTILLVFGGVFAAWQAGQGAMSGTAVRQAGKSTADKIASASFFRDDLDVMTNVVRVSKDQKNVIVLLLDTLQNDLFEKAVSEDADLRRQFAGFRLFTNTTGHFPYTSLSIPAVLTGEPYPALNESIPAYRERVAQKRVEAVLQKRGFEASRVQLESRPDFISSETSACRSYTSIYDLAGFRQLPVVLKPFFYNEGHFRFTSLCGSTPTGNSEIDLAVFDKLIRDTQATAETPTVKYLHFWGAHPPTTLNANCTLRGQSQAFSEFPSQAHCMLRRVGAYLDKLRELGVFDNTMIFVISDHGTRYDFLKRSPNPSVPSYVRSSAYASLAFHDFDETADFSTTNAPATLADIYPTILSAFGQAVDGPAVDLRTLEEGAKRERNFIFYKGSADARQNFLPQVERFRVVGDVRDPSSWSRRNLDGSAQLVGNLPFGQLMLGEPATSKYLGLGWSAEAESVPASWILSNPASISGRLPDAPNVRMTLRFVNPHPDQHIRIKLNGRVVAEWDLPEPTPWMDRTILFRPRPEEIGQPARIDIEAAKIAQPPNNPRSLGLGVRMIDIDRAPEEATPADFPDTTDVPFDGVLGRMPLNDPSTREALNDAWSIEDPSVPASWIIAQPATMTGRLPSAPKLRIGLRLMSPHAGQRVKLTINGRELAEWYLPEPVDWTERAVVVAPDPGDLQGPATIGIEVSKIEPLGENSSRKVGIALSELVISPVN